MALGGSGVGQIALYPILIRKGSTSVALYGLGNIRDERLNRMFQTPHAVQWMRPEVHEGCEVSDWFNILVLHQNRVKANPKNAINEHFLPRFLDFIVWGHEHECLIDPKEVSGMGFHITQPGSSVATSLIEGESKPKHVLLLEIKGNQYRPTKIPLNSVRPFVYAEVILKDEQDIDPNDQDSVLQHLDKVVASLIDKSTKTAESKSETQLPLVRMKVDYSGFTTINPQRFGQKYVGKVANPQDILIFSKSANRDSKVKFDDAERLRPEELNQQNIEALVAESNLKMEVLPVNDLDVALQNFVNKDDKMAFYACLQYNLNETRVKISKDSDLAKCGEEDIILKAGEYLEERVKERSTKGKEASQFTPGRLSSQDLTSKRAGESGPTVSFGDDEDSTLFPKSKSTAKGRKDSSLSFRSSHDNSQAGKTTTRGRGRGRGRGVNSLKQTTLDAAMGPRQSRRAASSVASQSVRTIAEDVEDMDSGSSDGAPELGINDISNTSDEEETHKTKGRKRAAPRGKGRAASSGSKRGRGSGSTSASIQKILIGNDEDDDDDDEDERPKKTNTTQPRVKRNYGNLRK